MQEVARSPSLSEMLGKAIVADVQGANGTELRLEDLIQQLQGASPDDVDAIIERATKGVPQETLRQVFAMWALSIAVIGQEVFEFDLVNGELSSYTKADDTASAMLNIPGWQLPVTIRGKSPTELDETFQATGPIPIRFKRENGQWKIDAIGSNERLLERLKQTKTWKQHAEIEAVLENARAAYAAKEWVKLLECFTRTGKYRWTLQTNSKMPAQESPLPEAEGDRQMEQLLSETGRWFILQAAAGKTDEQPLPNETQSREFRVLFDELLSCPAAEVEGRLIRMAEMVPESLLDAGFAGVAIQSVVMPPETYRFEFDGCRVADVKLDQDAASASLIRDGEPPSPLLLLRQDGKWKIDSIGTPEALQQQVRISQQRQNGASPRAAVEGFRETMADGRFQTALNCMTEDARDEWLGEMLLGLMNTTSEAEYPAHPKPPGTASRFDWSNDHFQIRFSVGGQFDRVVREVTDLPEIRDRSLTADQRRKLAIGLAKRIEGAPDYLPLLLENRAILLPAEFTPAAFGEFEEVPDRAKPEKGAKKYRLQPASPDQQPLELDIIQINGLWKLNTIIDPAMKPWPLPVEELTPPAEATAVDGAAGLP